MIQELTEEQIMFAEQLKRAKQWLLKNMPVCDGKTVHDNTVISDENLAAMLAAYHVQTPLVRRRLPATRAGVTHKAEIRAEGESKVLDVYIISSAYANGRLAEVFLRCGLQGTIISGLLDALSITLSVALQYGVPLEHLCDKLEHMRFDPQGYSGPEFGFAKSVVDYVARYLRARYCKETK